MKIRNRLAFLFTGIVAGLMLVFCLIIYALSAEYREDEFYGRLREKALVTARLLYESNQVLTPETMHLIEAEGRTVLFQEHLTVYEASGKLVYDNGTAPHPFSTAMHQRLIASTTGEKRHRMGETEYLYKLHKEPATSLVVVVSAIDAYGVSKIRFLVGVLTMGWLGAVLASIAGGWIFSGNALRPIADVISQVEAIDPLHLEGQQVVAGKEKDEIALLARTFNRMLGRIRGTLAAQRSFASNVSHELRTPLTVMRGQIEVALMQNRSEEEYRGLLQSLGEEVGSLTVLTNDLLEMAQASAETSVPLAMARVDEIVLQAEAELRRKQNDYRVIVNYAEAPEEEEAYRLPVNERLLKNAFINLMDNACKFSPDHTVEVTMRLHDGQVAIEFTDRGPGIKPAEIPLLFEPFFRSGESEKLPGHGIGLPLVKQIVDLHQGRVEVASKVGKGTTFTILLPNARQEGPVV